MSYDPLQPQMSARADGRVIDAGLQAHMRSVYNTMCWGLALTAAIAWSVANVQPLFHLVFETAFRWVAIFAPLAFLMFGFTPSRIERMPASTVRTMFMTFAALMGVSMAVLFVVYTGTSIARTFFVTAGMFAGTSLYGYTTKKDLTSMGSFMSMGVIGIMLACIVNIFLASVAINFVISVLGVVIFTGLAAWETQAIKERYSESYGTDANDKMATVGALSLYMSFINLFQFMMNFMGQSRN